MWLSFICVCIFYSTFAKAQFDSYEINQIDLTPIHDAIIFNDIADIINDFENNMNTQLNENLFSGSDSGEDIEDLLSEYNHYLDKEHKQRIHYIEKSKGKNKVPLIHREKYTKLKQSARNKYDASNNFFNNMKYAQSAFPEPLNLFVSKLNVDNKSEYIDRPQGYKEGIPNILTQMNDEKALLNLIPTISNFNKPMSSCYCSVNQIPCKCGCKQCFILTDPLPTKNLNRYDHQNILIENFPKTSKYGQQNKINNGHEDKLNIRIKIDVQLPKILSDLLRSIQKYRNQEKTTEREGVLSNEIISAVNLPFTYLNFPIPVDLHKKNYNKHDNSGVHKITIHKKKKARVGNNSKKHTGKKVITFHSIKQDQPLGYNITEENNRISKNSSVNPQSSLTGIEELQTTKPQNDEMITNNTSNTVTELPLKNLNDSIKTIYLMVNITKKNNNDINDSLKIENSIETDFVEKDNKTTVEPLRLKREALEKNSSMTVIPQTLKQSFENKTKDLKKFNKTIAGEIELLYWPIETKNVTLVRSKNITALIMERETKKAKLNMTYDKIRSNRTVALEQAIFGDVDWNDVDTVAPIFMSFVGKYIRGILTFCSQSLCHSMNCAKKICLHRICTPDNRFNQRGHCSGNNETDSVAAMESIMDLPSNIGFQIVDILKDKMLGKLYGKATVCIISKCSTFVASKKNFQRSKCISKELNSLGHCPIIVKNA
ncbi:uncharacterized protein LOC123872523 [Maniola jurtina]|uniref:uncharacterized protein LOC123872523 n=1 Tax=Maniola jurtina TaxID=191418 RepID=UPI001E68728C|nr:uncharacterized protein LOC123872523 [Maniola jurtina]